MRNSISNKSYTFIKPIIVIYLLYFLLTILLFIFCPTVAFAAQPPIEEVTDYYGNIEYVGKDAYGYYNDPAIDTTRGTARLAVRNTITSQVQDVINTQGDYYSYDSYSLYDKFRIKLHWYSWKKYSNEYESFTQFKRNWNPNNSLRKEIRGLFANKK